MRPPRKAYLVIGEARQLAAPKRQPHWSRADIKRRFCALSVILDDRYRGSTCGGAEEYVSKDAFGNLIGSFETNYVQKNMT